MLLIDMHWMDKEESSKNNEVLFRYILHNTIPIPILSVLPSSRDALSSDDQFRIWLYLTNAYRLGLDMIFNQRALVSKLKTLIELDKNPIQSQTMGDPFYHIFE